MDIGFELAEFDIVWTNEFNPDIADMYEHGMTALHWSADPSSSLRLISSRKSITQITPEEVLTSAFPRGRPKVFGVIGGPPCPDFSIGGKNRGHEGDRGKLSKTYIDMICELKPDFFLMENVPGLVSTAKHKTFLNSLRAQLKESGFVTDLKILNALEFNVPQDRERVFMVGLCDRLYRKVYKREKLPDSDGWFSYPVAVYPDSKKLNWPGTSKFGHHPCRPICLPLELTVYPLLASMPPPSELPNGTEGFVPYSDRFKSVDEGDVSRKSFKRLHRYRYSPTACYGNNEVHLHPWEPRRLSVREALRIQTVPDDYILPASTPLTVKFKMIGNGVPCNLARAMAEALKGVVQ